MLWCQTKEEVGIYLRDGQETSGTCFISSDRLVKGVLCETTHWAIKASGAPEVVFLFKCLLSGFLTVTSHSATKRPADANRRCPGTGTVPSATATQAPRLGGASWTAAPRRCGRGSPEAGGEGARVETGRSAAAGGRRTRFDGESNEKTEATQRRHT